MPKKKPDAASTNSSAAKTKSGEQNAKPISKADVSQFLNAYAKKAPQQAPAPAPVDESINKLKDTFGALSDSQLWVACQILQTWHSSIDGKELYTKVKGLSTGIDRALAIRDHVSSVLNKSVSSCAADQLFSVEHACWAADPRGNARLGVVMKLVPWDFQFVAVCLDKGDCRLDLRLTCEPRKKTSNVLDPLMFVDNFLNDLVIRLFMEHGKHLVEWLFVPSIQMLKDMIRVFEESGQQAADVNIARDVLHIREAIMMQTTYKLDMYQAQQRLEGKAHFLCHLGTGIPLCTNVDDCSIEEAIVGHSKLVEAVASFLHADFPKLQARHSAQVSIPRTIKASILKIIHKLGVLLGKEESFRSFPSLILLLAEVLIFFHQDSSLASFWEQEKKPPKPNFAMNKDSQPKPSTTIAYEISDEVILNALSKWKMIMGKYLGEPAPEPMMTDYPYYGGVNFKPRRFDGTPGTNLLTAKWPRASSSVDNINQASVGGTEKARQAGGASTVGDHETGRRNSLEYDSWSASLGDMGSSFDGMRNPLSHPSEGLYEDVFNDDAAYDWGDNLGFSGRSTNSEFYQRDPLFDYDYLTPPPPPPPIEPPPDLAFFDNNIASKLSQERTRVLEAFRASKAAFNDERPDFGDEANNFRLASQFDNLTLGGSERGEQGDVLQNNKVRDSTSSDTKKSERGPPPPVPVRKYGKGQGTTSGVDV